MKSSLLKIYFRVELPDAEASKSALTFCAKRNGFPREKQWARCLFVYEGTPSSLRRHNASYSHLL